MKRLWDCMKRQVISVLPTTTVQEAARIAVEKRVGTLPVVDAQGVLVGIVRLQDLLNVFMPDFVGLLERIDFVHDFGALEDLTPTEGVRARRLTMADLMQPPVAVEENCGLLRAFAIQMKRQTYDLPVVDAQGRLVGLASRVDVAAAFLAAWTGQECAA